MRVIVADDAALVRAGIARLLADEGFDVVAEVADSEQLLFAVANERPDVAVVDVRMPPGYTDEGIRAAERIKERFPAVGVLVLSQHAAPPQALRLLRRGSSGMGYMLKERVSDVAEFVGALRRVAAGGTAVDREVIATLLERVRRQDPLEELSQREREILALMAEGRSNHGIASTLFVSPKTVETHIGNVFSKLDLPPAPDDHRRVLAVLAYLRSG